MQYICYPRLNYRSKKNLISEKYRYGKKIPYKPDSKLLTRLSRELGMEREKIWRQLIEERKALRLELGLLPD